MANFVSRNVLLCVVPAVVLLISVYWFKKKKKMKPDILPQAKESTLSVNDSNDVYESQGSTYSSVECASDFSNTLSDASSISSPESSLRTSSVSGEVLVKKAVGDCIEALTVSNHIGQINYDVISITKENLTEHSNSQIQTNEKSENSIVEPLVEMKQLVSVDCENNESIEDPMQQAENIVNSYIIANTSLSAPSKKCSSENEVNEAANNTSDFSSSLQCSDVNSEVEIEQEQKCEVSEISIVNDTEELVIEQTGDTPIKDSNTNVESDSPDSHSSVLDENSLSSVSDESERQTDFKYKDSPSSVFDGNSISDVSDKTDISNENNLKTDKIYKSNVDYVNDVSAASCADSNKTDNYSIKLNKNSFLVKTILGDVSNEVFSSSLVENSPSSSHHSSSLLPDCLQSISSEDSFFSVKEDLCVDQHNNQPMQLSKEVDSNDDNNCNSSVATSLTSEIMSLDSENVISSTSSDKNCNLAERQSEVVDNLQSDATVSSTVDNKDTTKLNGEQAPSLTHIESLSSSETVKYQDEQLEQSENKVADLDVVDMKSSGVVPGLFVYEFDLPQELCGRLIGKQGKHVKSIKERTNANVFIKRHPFDTNLKTVVVEGSRASVFEALEIIRRKFPPSQFPTVTLIQTNMMSSQGLPPLPESLQLHLPEGASCDVILSSLVSADHFFLQQPTHPTYPSLSTLDQCMITCYTQMDTPLLPQPVEAGIICAAPVMNGWFRAQIVYVFENRTECEIKFVDYGGFSQVSISSLRQIRSDFMTLPFQASECYLANVRPVDPNAGWSSEATSVFEELAQGQILQALLVDYAEDGIPYVHLYKVQGVSNMFINRELVERGLAVWVDNVHWDPH